MAGSAAVGSANMVVSIKSELINVKSEINIVITTEIADTALIKPPTRIKKEPKAEHETSVMGSESPTSVPIVVSPISGQSVKNELFASNQDCAVADQSDVKSRFSEVDKSDESDEDHEEWQEVKRMRLD